jgi:hypothetical protein
MPGPQPFSASFGVSSPADGLGWYNGAPWALRFADTVGALFGPNRGAVKSLADPCDCPAQRLY